MPKIDINESFLLRIISCGSVDDGKSTLLGRMIYETGNLPSDQLSNNGELIEDINNYDFSLLFDGLSVEREQGITIDVAYRYFKINNCNLIIADCPGHEQYTANMATAASKAQVAFILIDAKKGIVEQTLRHLYICAFMGVKFIIACINKMDSINYDETIYLNIVSEFKKIDCNNKFEQIDFIPLSAKFGDNIIKNSINMPWYKDDALYPTLIKIAKNCEISPEADFRLFVQNVIKSNGTRNYLGRNIGGKISIGDKIIVGRTKQEANIIKIISNDGNTEFSEKGSSISINIDKDLDISRGDLICSSKNHCLFSDKLSAEIIWFNSNPLIKWRKFTIKCGTQIVSGLVSRIKGKIDTLNGNIVSTNIIKANEIGICDVFLEQKIAFDKYENYKDTGNFIIIDPVTNETIGAGIIKHELRRANNITPVTSKISIEQRQNILHQKSHVIWLTGLSGSGKSTIAKSLEQLLYEKGFKTFILDGDNLRTGINKDLGFTDNDRVENIRRAGEISKLMFEAGIIVICAFISPFAADRQMIRKLFNNEDFTEIYIKASIETCIARDPKSLYSRAIKGEIPNFTGINSIYEIPQKPDIIIDTEIYDINNSIEYLYNKLITKISL